ncbi:MAG: DUF4342 domain-containing protein [Leptolyngbya sp. BL-A-14]
MKRDTDITTETTDDINNLVETNAVEVGAEPIDDATQEAAESTNSVNTEEFRLQGDELVAKVKALIHEGNIRRIIIKNEAGNTLIEIPLTVGVVGGVLSAALFPVLAAVGAIGAVVAHLTLVIEKRE